MQGMRTLLGLEYSMIQGCECFLRGCTVAAAARKRSSTIDQFSLGHMPGYRSADTSKRAVIRWEPRPWPWHVHNTFQLQKVTQPAWQGSRAPDDLVCDVPCPGETLGSVVSGHGRGHGDGKLCTAYKQGPSPHLHTTHAMNTSLNRWTSTRKV